LIKQERKSTEIFENGQKYLSKKLSNPQVLKSGFCHFWVCDHPAANTGFFLLLWLHKKNYIFEKKRFRDVFMLPYYRHQWTTKNNQNN